MKPLASFFERLKNLTVPDGALRDAVTLALSEVMQIDVDRSHVRIKGTTAFLNVSPLIKAEVQFKERELLLHAARTLGKPVLTGIR